MWGCCRGVKNLNVSAKRGTDELFEAPTRVYEQFVVADYECVDTRNPGCFSEQYE